MEGCAKTATVQCHAKRLASDGPLVERDLKSAVHGVNDRVDFIAEVDVPPTSLRSAQKLRRKGKERKNN